jgi:2-C-methyl-D-erythritol 4-phosphate cytidylyltransferase
MRTVALIVAVTREGEAGRPDGDGASTLLAPLAGRPVAEHSIAAFEAAPEVDEVLLLASPTVAGGLRTGPATKRVEATGSRAESMALALEALGIGARGIEARGEDGCHLLIHDAARPLVAPRVIADCAAALRSAKAVCAAVPASDTMVQVTGDFITERPRRDRLRRREYPQGFHLPVISRGYRLALADPDYRPTDDCGVVLRYLPGVPVRLVPGSEQSFPVTSPLDLEIAELILGAGSS